MSLRQGKKEKKGSCFLFVDGGKNRQSSTHTFHHSSKEDGMFLMMSLIFRIFVVLNVCMACWMISCLCVEICRPVKNSS